VLTAVADDRTASDVLAAGAVGYLTKDLAIRDLVDAVASAARGQTVVAPKMLDGILARARSPLTMPGATLTARERETLQLLADGLGVDEIAVELGVSRHTARKHVQGVLTKLGAHTQLEAVAIARREGLLESS
jgi:DNA-binding NarL/FixJ family response regulator